MHRQAAHSDVFSAVADPTRRAILDRLRKGPSPVNELASGFRVSRPAISKHLRILRTARLVHEKRKGRKSTAGSGTRTSQVSSVISNNPRRIKNDSRNAGLIERWRPRHSRYGK